MDLTKPPDKILALSIAGVVVLIWLLVWLFGPKPVSVEPAEKLPISLTDLQPKELTPEEKTVGETIPETWGRDPFETPYQFQVEDTKTPADKGGRPGSQPVSEGQEYKLSTVLISGTNRLAVIDDRVYGVGDQIGEEKISSITLDHVVLTGVQGERVLEVPQPQTKVTVESTGRK
jgi:hypothetical protein